MDPLDIPLRDIHLPEPISWWPLAPGWWVSAGVVVLLAAAVMFVWYWRKRRRVQRAALNELAGIESRYREHADTHLLARDLSRLARRTALALAGERAYAATTGLEWSNHLDTLNASGTSSDLIKIALARAPYRKDETLDGEALLNAFRPWLAGLRRPRTAAE